MIATATGTEIEIGTETAGLTETGIATTIADMIATAIMTADLTTATGAGTAIVGSIGTAIVGCTKNGMADLSVSLSQTRTEGLCAFRFALFMSLPPHKDDEAA
jgi:hypothetical protein